MPDPTGFPSLNAFIESLQSERFAEFAPRAESRVAHEDAFSEMREHILGLYEGVEAPHSFMDETGAIFDCIPVEQQPSLRGSAEAVPVAPDLPPPPDQRGEIPAGVADQDERRDNLADSALTPDRSDAYGNVMHCPEGTIPMRRVTLEDLTRFETLQDFFAKGPRGAARPPRMTEPTTVAPTHRWAHAYQIVDNGGGHSFLNIWQPAIGANQIFSLSQHWYTAGSSAGVQTIECGWQVYPALYGDARPHLFTYWTADGYNKTGCYNLTCSAFVQTSSTFAPGMAVGPARPGGDDLHEQRLRRGGVGGERLQEGVHAGGDALLVGGVALGVRRVGHPAHDLGRRLVEEGEDALLLVGEVLVERGLGHARLARDRLGARLGVSDPREDVRGGLEQAPALDGETHRQRRGVAASGDGWGGALGSGHAPHGR